MKVKHTHTRKQKTILKHRMERSLWMKEGAVEGIKFELHSQEGADFWLDKEAQKHILGKPEIDTLSKAQMTVGRREAEDRKEVSC